MLCAVAHRNNIFGSDIVRFSRRAEVDKDWFMVFHIFTGLDKMIYRRARKWSAGPISDVPGRRAPKMMGGGVNFHTLSPTRPGLSAQHRHPSISQFLPLPLCRARLDYIPPTSSLII
jgi:hypothetical protein